MEKKRGTKVLSIVALFVAVIAVTVAFAALSRTLTINGTSTVKKGDWNIHFENLSPLSDEDENLSSALVGSAQIVSFPSITATDEGEATKIGDYDVSFSRPGDSVSFTFDIVNSGDYDAKLSELTYGEKSCSVIIPDDETANDKEGNEALVCDNLTYVLTYADGGDEVNVDDVIEAKSTKSVILTLTYSDTTSSANDVIPTDDVKISGLDITLKYIQD